MKIIHLDCTGIKEDIGEMSDSLARNQVENMLLDYSGKKITIRVTVDRQLKKQFTERQTVHCPESGWTK